MKKIAVIGGGASGMIAAICAAQNGANVTIFEHMPRMGRKLLLTGSGKCNISNTDMDIRHFHSEDIDVVASVLERCGSDATRHFFEKLGLFFREKNGYVYPFCEQASAVVDVLRFTIRDMGIDVHTDTGWPGDAFYKKVTQIGTHQKVSTWYIELLLDE